MRRGRGASTARSRSRRRPTYASTTLLHQRCRIRPQAIRRAAMTVSPAYSM
ncbi:hypothetical protein GLA29479_5051 [Lysobacter antibioticus]|nr:hypothetical protein GLA29479_5051 [Lysobacter antibioticus]